jgi:spore germination protein KA
MFNKTKPNAGQQTGPQEITTERLKQALCNCPDIIYSDISVNVNRNLRHTVVYVDGMVDHRMIDDYILKPLVQEDVFFEARSQKAVIELIIQGTVYHSVRTIRTNLDECIGDLMSGSVALIFDESKLAVTFEVKGFEKRSLTEPTNENVLKGSKEAFVEVLRVNTALVRRRLQTKELKLIQLELGTRSKTAIEIVYLDGVANMNTVSEVKRRLTNSSYDGVVSAGQIEAFLLDNPKSFFPQVLYTERADKFCGNILEGRVGIMIDGIPLAYIVPVDINSFLQAPEDYALSNITSSLFRFLRHVSAFAALIMPAAYVSMTTFHHEMLPSELVVAIVTSKQGVPFPTFIEVLLMLFAFEVLLEAGLRLPRAIGQAVSIVGAVVVGQAAITAKILSPGVVIVIAAAGITGFVLPSQDLSNTVRVCRILLVLCSIVSGLFGVIVGLIVILYHLCTLEVFDTPYMSPFVANEGEEMFNDTVVRRAWFYMKKRPKNVGAGDVKRQGS